MTYKPKLKDSSVSRHYQELQHQEDEEQTQRLVHPDEQEIEDERDREAYDKLARYYSKLYGLSSG
jgi:hypothetical protein